MRILHCPENVAGTAWILSRAERKIGLDSEVMVFQKSRWGYPADIDLQLTKNRPGRSALKLLAFFIKALRRYDVFHFNHGSSFLPHGRLPGSFEHSDLAVLRALGKKIVVSYLGCDIRQKGFCTRNFSISACHPGNCQVSPCNDETDALKVKRAAIFGRHAHKIFGGGPDLLRLLPTKAEFLPIAQVDLNDWQPERQSRDDKLTLLHSPTNRGIKGTKYILAAVDRLRSRYKDIELVLIEGVPHSKVKAVYAQADLVIDQLLCGWYGGFAVEMMALGKPVVCYIREEDLALVPRQMKEDLPIVSANPNNIYEVLSSLVEQRDQLRLIGERSRAYVERWHDPMKIAARTKEVYESLYVD